MSLVRVMGIINVTPDSFSDGGIFFDPAAAKEQADELVAAGADLLDVGGESTRPYADPVSLEQELARVIPVIQAIRAHHTLPISIDTTKAEVARQALAAGAGIINDISALRSDPQMIDLVRQTDVPLIIMHMQGTPADMQQAPSYTDVVAEICDFFRERLAWLEGQGVDLERVTIDPGIGFGKSQAHNLTLLKHLSSLTALGRPVLLGHSRKRFIGELTGLPPGERDQATAVLSALAVAQGVSIIRVHDVAATRQAVRLAEAVLAA